MSDSIESKHRAVMNAWADLLKEAFSGYGFALLVFDWGDKGRMNWISNAKREDMIAALKEAAATLEGRSHEAPEKQQ